MFNSSVIGIAALATPLLFAGPVQAEACQNGICVSGHDNGSGVVVRYHVQNGPVTNVNIRTPDGNQWEGGPSGAVKLRRFSTTRYSIQSCVKGTGLFGRSSCGAWANFRHTIKEPFSNW